MGKIKFCTYFLLIYCILIGVCEGGRYGGGSRSRGGTTYSRPSTSYSRPSTSYSRPSPSYSRPSPSYSHPSPPSTNIGWHPSVVQPKTTVSQTNQAAPHGPPTNTKPIGWNVPKTSGGAPHPPPSTHHQTHYPGTNQKPVTTVHYPGGNNNNNNQRSNTHYTGTGTGGGINQKKTVTNVQHSSSHLPPPPPGPYGPPRTGTYQQSGYNNGPQKVKIVNKYYNNYPGYYNIPQPNYHYPGYYYQPTYYHYSSSDTGSGALGFFLGYSLAKLTTPTYSHYSFYDGYRPRYDHYTVVHYHHNREQAPKEPIIQPNSIVGCIGDSKTVCPGNTTSLCTSDGILMCVVSATHTQPCTDNRQVNCVRSTVPCVNNTIDDCKSTTTNMTIVNIPCVTTAKVFGNITYINNTIIVNNGTDKNQTMNGSTTTTSTQYPITTTPTTSNTIIVNNGTDKNQTMNGTTTTTSTQYPITTTPEPLITTITTSNRRKRDTNNVPQEFCVTVVALPAKKQESDGEKLFKNTKSIISNFIVNAWGLKN